MKRLHLLLYATLFGATAALAAGRPLSDCTHAARLEVAGYAGTETLAGVPVLVRVSESIPGFRYADCGTGGAGLVFCDEANEVVFPHEIDEWNPGGESLVWVRLPELAFGTAFRMGWSGTAVAPDPHAVWTDYAGVWHMNEASGTAFDSTANGLDAVPSCGTNGTPATLAQMVAYENGACGRARVNSVRLPGRGNDRQNYLKTPAVGTALTGTAFSVSGWFNGEYWNDGTSWGPRLISTKPVASDDPGWELRNLAGNRWCGITVNANDGFSFDSPDMSTSWVFLTVVFFGNSCACYTNGFESASGSIQPISTTGTPYAFGNTTTGSRWSFIGQYDEIRLRGGTLSADRIRADYDMIADRDFLSFGTVIDMPDAPTVLAEGDLAPGVSIRLGGAPNGWTLHYTTDGSTPTADSPVYEEPFALAESATVKVVAVNDEFGWTSGVAEQRFDLAPPLAVTGAQARQRYPWNGLVDVDFTLAGDTAKCYRVSLDVTDLDGGTNLAARTVWEDRAMYDAPPNHGTLTNAVLDVAPGAHRFVWDAGADLPEGFVADRLAVSLRAEYLHDTALYMVVDLSGGPDAAHYPVSYLPDVPEGGWTDEYKTEKLVLRRIEPGWFTMGSPEGEVGRMGDSVPFDETQHNVTLTKPLYASVFEMTQKQWMHVAATNPSVHLGDTRPVDSIGYSEMRGALDLSWPAEKGVDESSFIGKFQHHVNGMRFDLPTEAQWEYACRAGTVTALNNGKDLDSSGNNLSEVGRWDNNKTDGNGGYAEHTVVGSYRPNAWGLFDMHGNSWEPCLDWASNDIAFDCEDPEGPVSGNLLHVARGGAWTSGDFNCRSATRCKWEVEPSTISSDRAGIRLFLHDAPAVIEAPIVAPEGLTATTNRTGDVTLSWEPLAGAYAYQIRRSKTGVFEDGTWLNTVTNTTYADWTAEARADYTYWVRAQFESGKVGRWSKGVEIREIPKTYTVSFHANGGTGTMAGVSFLHGTQTSLPRNAFTRDWFTFTGWSTTPDGPAVAANCAVVDQFLATSDGSVTLYAVWEEFPYRYSIGGAPESVTIVEATNTLSGAVSIPTLIEGFPVISVGNSSFDTCSLITSITIPAGVISIGTLAFADCSCLNSITIPDGVERIGAGAFYGCSALSSVALPDSVSVLGQNAFSLCSTLSSIAIPEGVQNIGAQTFFGCTNLTTVTIPNSVTNIERSAFYDCSSLTSLTIPDGVSSIGDFAFWGCSELATISLPASVESMGENVFSACSNLLEVAIPEGATSIGDQMFFGCTNLTTVTIPNSVTNIGRSAFYNCSSLANLAIPSEVTNIGYAAFHGCSSLTSLTIPDGVSSIGDFAFWGCSDLAIVTIPNSVTNIGYAAFHGCSSLTSLAIPESVTSIGNFAFQRCSELAIITLPNTMESMGKNVFAGCSNLRAVAIPDGVPTIGYQAFIGCTNLTTVIIPNTVTSIGEDAFYKCSSLANLTIPNAVTSIGGTAFAHCSRLTSLVVPNSVITIGDNAFYGCSRLTSLFLPSRFIGKTSGMGIPSGCSVTFQN